MRKVENRVMLIGDKFNSIILAMDNGGDPGRFGNNNGGGTKIGNNKGVGNLPTALQAAGHAQSCRPRTFIEQFSSDPRKISKLNWYIERHNRALDYANSDWRLLHSEYGRYPDVRGEVNDRVTTEYFYLRSPMYTRYTSFQDVIDIILNTIYLT